MEPQEKIYCCYNNQEEKCNNKKNCLCIITAILLTAFSVVIGIIIGAALATTIMTALSAIIVLAIVLGLLLLLSIILMICNKNKCKKCKTYC